MKSLGVTWDGAMEQGGTRCLSSLFFVQASLGTVLSPAPPTPVHTHVRARTHTPAWPPVMGQAPCLAPFLHFLISSLQQHSEGHYCPHFTEKLRHRETEPLVRVIQLVGGIQTQAVWLYYLRPATNHCPPGLSDVSQTTCSVSNVVTTLPTVYRASAACQHRGSSVRHL